MIDSLAEETELGWREELDLDAAGTAGTSGLCNLDYVLKLMELRFSIFWSVRAHI